MQLYSIETGFFKLDGGAMFGVVPKQIWQKLQPADENNLCNWAMRCLLVEQNGKLILFDNGMGNKQNETFFGHYHLNGTDSLEKSLAKHGFCTDDITDMVLTHLHFDHCGGGIQWKKDGLGYEPTFKNAKYWVTQAQWDWATIAPNAREKASFLKENILPMQESGHLHFLDITQPEIFEGIGYELVFGHTECMLLPKISLKNGKKALFCADLIPSNSHIRLPYVMGYDMRPLQTLTEKQRILEQAAEQGTALIFEHDPKIEACTIIATEKGIEKAEVLHISDLN